jgi:hypothetical protein
MRGIKTLVVAVALLVAPAAVSHAQMIGGQFSGFMGSGFGMVGAPGAVGGGYYSPYGYGYGYNSYGMGYPGSFGTYVAPVVTGYPYTGYPGGFGYYSYPATVNTMGPLMQTIKKTTMQRRRR